MTRSFWKWTATLVASTWFGGLGLLALGLVPTMWVAYVALPGMFASSITPALWATDLHEEEVQRGRNTKRTAL